MPRPHKQRRICTRPKYREFSSKTENITNEIIMTYEEYEAIRLMDHEGLNQVEASDFMGVGRTTFQGIYEEARKKMATFLVNGARLKVSGGNYLISDHNGKNCCHDRGCFRVRN